MKAITLPQPVASLIAFLLKSIVTRRDAQLRSLVGQTIAIHAGREWDDFPFSGGDSLAVDEVAHHATGTADGPVLLEAMGHARDSPGYVVGTAFVKAHRRLTGADSAAALCPAEGLYGLILEDVRRFREPIKATGHRGPWDWEPPERWGELLVTEKEA